MSDWSVVKARFLERVDQVPGHRADPDARVKLQPKEPVPAPDGLSKAETAMLAADLNYQSCTWGQVWLDAPRPTPLRRWFRRCMTP